MYYKVNIVNKFLICILLGFCFANCNLEIEAPIESEKRKPARYSVLKKYILKTPKEKAASTFKEAKLGKLPNECDERQTRISPNLFYFSCFRIINGKWSIVVNDKHSAFYDRIKGPVFSLNDRHLAYIAINYYNKRNDTLVLDGENIDTFQEIKGISFSPNSQQLFVNIRDKSINYNNMYSKNYTRIKQIVFSSDSNNLAFIAVVDKDFFVVKNGEEGPKFDDVSNLVFGPKNELSYTAKLGNKSFQVSNGVIGEKYNGVGKVIYSPNGKRHCYIVYKNKKAAIILDGKIGKFYKNVYNPVFSPNSEDFMYSADTQSYNSFVVLNGVPGTIYGWHNYLTFGLKNQIAYTASNINSDKQFVIFNGKKGKPYKLISYPVISPEGKQIAYKVTSDGLIVLNGVEGKAYYSTVSDPIFSPDGKHLTYTVNDEFVVINEIEQPKYKKVYTQSLRYDKNSKYLVYIALDHQNYIWRKVVKLNN
ncbi:MAG: PD40 domain-containing protein [Bacteroidetes bacterium]|nr:PD40 domain-containing protein [Bacteroidota bacterium]